MNNYQQNIPAPPSVNTVKVVEQSFQSGNTQNPIGQSIVVEKLSNEGFDVFVNGARIALRSHHNRYISGDKDGKVELSKKKKRKSNLDC